MTRRCRACRGKFSKYHSAYTKRPIDLKIWIYLSLATFYNLKKISIFLEDPRAQICELAWIDPTPHSLKEKYIFKNIGPYFSL